MQAVLLTTETALCSGSVGRARLYEGHFVLFNSSRAHPGREDSGAKTRTRVQATAVRAAPGALGHL